MRKTFGEKLRGLLESEQWTQAYLAKKLGFKQQAVANYLADIRFPRKKTIEALAAAFGKSPSYFYDDAEIGDVLYSPLVSVVIRASSLKNLKDLPERRTELIEVPVVSGEIAGGPGQVADDRVEDWAWIPVSQLHGKTHANLVCVKVTGDSMEPRISEGAMVCVDKSDLPLPDRKHPAEAIYAVRHSGNLVSVKYIGFTDHIMALMSANPAHPPTPVDLRDNPSPVIGRVVWMWQPME